MKYSSENFQNVINCALTEAFKGFYSIRILNKEFISELDENTKNAIAEDLNLWHKEVSIKSFGDLIEKHSPWSSPLFFLVNKTADTCYFLLSITDSIENIDSILVPLEALVNSINTGLSLLFDIDLESDDIIDIQFLK